MNKLADRLSAALAANLGGGDARPPNGTAVLWNGFMALSRARSCGPFGPNPISYPEIEAWSHLMQVPLRPHHVEALVAMDNVWMDHSYGKIQGGRPASAALTPAVFDAVMG